MNSEGQIPILNRNWKNGLKSSSHNQQTWPILDKVSLFAKTSSMIIVMSSEQQILEFVCYFLKQYRAVIYKTIQGC